MIDPHQPNLDGPVVFLFGLLTILALFWTFFTAMK